MLEQAEEKTSAFLFAAISSAKERIAFMIIVIRNQARNEERAQLMALLGQVSGNQRPIATAKIGEREVIALDGNALDIHSHTIISQQSAVERIVPIKTPY